MAIQHAPMMTAHKGKRQRIQTSCGRRAYQRKTVSIILLVRSFGTGAVAVAPTPVSPTMACTPCADPNHSFAKDRLDRTLHLPSRNQVVTCGLVQSMLPVGFLQKDDPDCQFLHAVGTYCGCPVLPTNPCRFSSCINKDDDSLYDPTLVVDDFWGSTATTTCDVVHSFLESTEATSKDCLDYNDQWAVTCGCTTATSSSDTPTAVHSDSTTMSTHHDDMVGCTLCLNGATPRFSNKDMLHFVNQRAKLYLHDNLEFLVGENNNSLNSSSAPSPTITCAMVDQLLQKGLAPPEMCASDENRLFAGVCGCPPREDACDFCPTRDMTVPNATFGLTRVVYGLDLTCRDMEYALTQMVATERRCWASKNFAFQCGCNQGTPWYLGASTRKQHATLAWIPRVTGFLSLLGSLYIVQDVLRKHYKRGIRSVSTYQLILLGMSVFDVASSAAWILSTVVLPEYDQERDSPSGIYQARGNEATCKLQGFFLELGFIGSTAFNASLTTYYLLVIVYRWNESKTKALRKYLLSIPTFLAVTLATAALPFYRPFFVGCLVSNPNSEVSRYADEWLYLVVFSILPVGISIVISVGNLIVICHYVWSTNQKADRWRFTSPHINTETRASVKRHPVLSDRGESSKMFGSGEFSAPIGSNNNNANVSTTSWVPQGWSATGTNISAYVFRRSGRQRRRTEGAVFWQAFLYVVAFLLTWVVYLVGQFKPYFSSNDDALYAFWITVLVLNPLMGFWNAFVYVKPWTWKLCRKRDNRKPSSEPEAWTFSARGKGANHDDVIPEAAQEVCQNHSSRGGSVRVDSSSSPRKNRPIHDEDSFSHLPIADLHEGDGIDKSSQHKSYAESITDDIANKVENEDSQR